MRQLRLRDLFAIITIAALLTAWLQAHRRAADVQASLGKQLRDVNKQLKATEAMLSRDRNYMDLTVESIQRQVAGLSMSLANAEMAYHKGDSLGLKYEFAAQRVRIKALERDLQSRKKHLAPQQPLVQPLRRSSTPG